MKIGRTPSLLDACPQIVRGELVRAFHGSPRRAEAFLRELPTRRRANMVLRVRSVLRYFAWRRGRPSAQAHFRPGHPLRNKTATIARFMAKVRLDVNERTFRQWVRRYYAGGVGVLQDARGTRVYVAREAPMYLRDFVAVLAMLDNGKARSIVAAVEALKPAAVEAGRPWPSLRTIQARVKEARQRARWERNAHLWRGVSWN